MSRLMFHIDDPASLEHLKRYVAWPAWRRWVWRTLGR